MEYYSKKSNFLNIAKIIMPFILLVIIEIECSNNRYINKHTNERALCFADGDSISIQLKDRTKFNCIFVEYGEPYVIVNVKHDNKIKQKSINMNTILKMQKTNKKSKKGPNKLWTYILLGVLIFLFYKAIYWANIGNLGA